MWEWIYTAFHRPSHPLYSRVSSVIWSLIIISISLLIIDISEIEVPGRSWLAVIDDLIVFAFGVELIVRVASYRPPSLAFYNMTIWQRVRAHFWGRVRFCLQPMLLIDILTVLGSFPLLRGLRALRLLRLVRSKQLFKYSNPFDGIARAFEENALLYGFGLSMFFAAVLVGGLSFYLTEHVANPGVTSLADGMWWSIVTVTTVGYGDLSPVTDLGRVVAGVLMICGMITLALFAGIVGSSLMGQVLSIREEQFRMSEYIDHIVICGYDPGARMLLDALQAELDLDHRDVVVFAQGERPPDVPLTFRWLAGDPTKESELDKVRLQQASAVILVGSRSEFPQQADAKTILTAFTIRRYLKLKPSKVKRNKELYIIAEILDAENVEHARTAGCDEVIETTRMGFSMLAHAIDMPGTATLIGELTDSKGHSLFVADAAVSVATERTFEAIAEDLKERYAVLVIGVRPPNSHEQINPRGDLIVEDGSDLIYIARGNLFA